MRILYLHILLALTVLGCGTDLGDYNAAGNRYTGSDARSRIERLHGPNGKKLPDSASNFYLFDGGSFNGSITYVAFDCSNVDDCWEAIESFNGPGRADFRRWTPSQYAVVMQGPGFYHTQLKGDPWSVRDIRNGMVYEKVTRDRDPKAYYPSRMEYFAIDLDKKRVYYHHECGGFPPDLTHP